MNRAFVEDALERTHDANPRKRAKALHDLCPCEVRVHVEAVWERVFAMTGDPDPRVRSQVLHALCDGSPNALRERVVDAVEDMQRDADPKLRRRARQVMASYRRTGKINVL